MLGKTARQFNQSRTNFRSILTPSQSIEMSNFLQSLSTASQKCKQLGIKLEVGTVINAWSGRTNSREERKMARMWQARERRA